jgi:anti-repressor protein
MSSVKIFEHPVFGQLQIIDEDGEQWFVARDVAKALGYSNPSKAVSDHCKKARKINMMEFDNESLSNYSAGNYSEVLVIPESDVHRLIMRSKLEKAEEYQEWVCGEVLPDIRKHGFHGTDDFVKKALSDPAGMIMFLQNYQEVKAQKEALDQRVVQLNREKAWIESKQVATSMNTASQYSRQNERLRVQIGDATNWKTVKAIKWLRDEFVLESGMFISLGHKLSKLSTRMGYEKKLVEDSKWGQTKAYHVDVIEAFRYELKKDLNLMSEYRRR